MPNKEICKKCRSNHVWGWNDRTEKDWEEEGWVFCNCAMKLLYVNEKAPQECMYRLEQMLNAQ